MADGREPESEQDLTFADPVAGPPGASASEQLPPGSYPPGPAPYPGATPYTGSGPYASPAGQPAPSNPQATASLVLGIVSLLLSVLFVPAFLGVVLGFVGLARSRRTEPPTGRGAAVTGIVLSVVGVVLGALLVAGAVGVVSDLAAEIEQEARSTAAGEEPDGPGATPFDPQDFDEVDTRQWESITKDPAGAEGRPVVVFAEVVQFDDDTGDDRFLAVAGVDRPGASGELESSAVFVGQEAALAAVRAGDVLRIHAVVTGSMELDTRLGGTSTVPVLTIARTEDVGFVDLGKDFTIGAAARDQIDLLRVPVTVTNGGTRPYTYSARLVATSKDGRTTYDEGTVLIEGLAPGREATTDVPFFDELPDGVVFRVQGAERYPE
ncbi:DUF4190 domain-containing protein [Promicromonospora sp. NPDC050880]|uniref:DUF4190 domain-containing protein n=1 Tax=Promicromonospora sp. NPDC050880 TaxID=3364406 RepID=UPI0037A809E4